MEPLLPQADYIDPDQIVSVITSQDKETILCQICLGIVINPVECRNCESLFCALEVMVGQVYKNCPVCKLSQWKFGSEVHKSYKSRLLNLKLKCFLHPECDKLEYTYEKYLIHVNQTMEGEPVPKGYYRLSFLGEKEAWEPYPQCNNSAANLYIQQGFTQFNIGSYKINTNQKTQTNTKTNFSRPLKMEKQQKRIHMPLWIAEVENRKYEPYSDATNDEIEKAYAQFLKGNRKGVLIKTGHYNYDIDFQIMSQINSVTKTSRKVRRIMI